MINGDLLAALVVQTGIAAAALYGTWRCVALQRFGEDRRLTLLAWFFGLFAAAVVLSAIWQLQIESQFPAHGGHVLIFHPVDNGTENGTFDRPIDRGLFHPEGIERVNLWLAGHHLLMLSSLAIGVWAFGRRRPDLQAPVALAAVSLAFLGDLIPTMLALEAGLTLYLAVQAFLNHVHRRTPGALQVALGFLLFFCGHLLFYVAHQPGVGHNSLGDVLDLVGIVLLVQVLPGTK